MSRQAHIIEDLGAEEYRQYWEDLRFIRAHMGILPRRAQELEPNGSEYSPEFMEALNNMTNHCTFTAH